MLQWRCDLHSLNSHRKECNFFLILNLQKGPWKGSSERPPDFKPYIFKVDYHHTTTLHSTFSIPNVCPLLHKLWPIKKYLLTLRSIILLWNFYREEKKTGELTTVFFSPFIKGTGEECRRVECKSAKLWGEMVKIIVRSCHRNPNIAN